jgi:hypothetical protein
VSTAALAFSLVTRKDSILERGERTEGEARAAPLERCQIQAPPVIDQDLHDAQLKAILSTRHPFRFHAIIPSSMWATFS